MLGIEFSRGVCLCAHVSSFSDINAFNFGPGLLSRYSDSLRAGRSGDRIPVGGEIFRTGPVAHPASNTIGTRSFLGVQRSVGGVDHPPI